MNSIAFPYKELPPTESELKQVLGKSHTYWQEIIKIVYNCYPAALEEWKYPGAKYGWSFRMKDKKRVLVYMIPHSGFMQVAFVFGQRATQVILSSNIDETVKTELQAARVYAEGRGIRIDVKKKATLKTIKQLLEIKIAN